MATLGRNMQLVLNVTDFFTVKLMLCYIAFSLIKNVRNLEGSVLGVKKLIPS
jgi:hypothetical protein